MRGKPETFVGFNGGVNLVDSPYALKDSEARDARNFVTTLRGKVRKRDGAATFIALPTAFDSLFPMQTPSPFLVAAQSGSIVVVNPAGSGVDRAYPTAGGWEWAQAPAQGGQGPLWGMNGLDAPLQWDGVAPTFSPWTTSVGTLPNGKYVVYAGNRVFVAGMSAYGALDDPGSAVVWSNLANPRDWPAENVLELDPRDGDRITGLGTFGPYVLVFKSNKVWVIYDLDTGANRRLSNGVGCVSHRSIAESPAGCFFLTEDQGVMLTDGSSLKRVSNRVQPLLDELQDAQRSRAAGVFHGDHYYLSISTSGSFNDLTLDYDVQTDSWWPHTLAEQDWAVWEPTPGAPALYAIKAGSGTINKPFVPGIRVDDGEAFAAYWKGRFHDFGSPMINKRVRWVHLEGRGKAAVEIARSYSTGEEELGDVDFATSGGLVELGDAEIFTPGVGRAFSVIVSNDTADELELDSYSFGVQARRGR